MKRRGFITRLGFAIAGVRTTWRGEPSFRTQVRIVAATAVVLAIVRPPAVWIGLVIVAAAMVLALEAANAALEALADTLHPARHPGIGKAKDMAAGAVLIASLAAAGVAASLAYSALP